MTKNSRNKNELERIASKATRWIGSIESLIAHTILFAGAFMFILFGVPFATVLLFLTTIVSLEAIYLSIFIQMSVNKATKDIEYIQEDVEDIQEDVDEIQEDVAEIEKDVDEIQEDVAEIEKDVDEIQEDVEEDEKEELARDKALMDKIELTLESLMSEIKHIKDRQK
jgi:septal ring factor EnvC (AmiA/AmiB activator)